MLVDEDDCFWWCIVEVLRIECDCVIVVEGLVSGDCICVVVLVNFVEGVCVEIYGDEVLDSVMFVFLIGVILL